MAADFALGKTNSLFLVERKDNLFIGGKNNMRKIISLAIAFVMALTLTMSVCAETYTVGYDIARYSGRILPERIVLKFASQKDAANIGVLKKCQKCGNGYANITCQEIYNIVSLGACNWSSHENNGCFVSEIYRYENGECGACGANYYSFESRPHHLHSQLHSYTGGGSDEFVSCIYC